MVTQIHREKTRESEMVNKINIIKYINMYLLFFVVSASLKDIKLYKVVILTMHS